MKTKVRLCEICGNEFYLKDRSSTAKTCSLECGKKLTKKRDKEFYWKNRKKILDYMKDHRKDPKKNRENVRRYYHRIRLEVLSHYSDKSMDFPHCACCKETDIRFLTIDHIYGVKGKRKNSYHLYCWLIKNNFPEGYQVLCFNCNLGRAHNKGICPHKEG